MAWFHPRHGPGFQTEGEQVREPVALGLPHLLVLQVKLECNLLDNLVAQLLTWLDVAIVFGPQMPLVVPLVALTLWTSRATHRVGLATPRFGMRETRQEHSAPSVWYGGGASMRYSDRCAFARSASVWSIGESSDARFLSWHS